MTNGSLDDKKLDDWGMILDDRGGLFDDRQHDLRIRRSEKGPPVASVSVLRIVAISGKVSIFFPDLLRPPMVNFLAGQRETILIFKKNLAIKKFWHYKGYELTNCSF